MVRRGRIILTAERRKSNFSDLGMCRNDGTPCGNRYDVHRMVSATPEGRHLALSPLMAAAMEVCG